jgi:hypothetical protein
MPSFVDANFPAAFDDVPALTPVPPASPPSGRFSLW